MAETLTRQWLLLRLIPRGPRKIDTASLEAQLTERGLVVHRRSLQRDLEALSEQMSGLCCDRRSKPYGWYWHADAPTLELPPMDVASAVTLEMMREQLVQVLPRSSVKVLEPLFTRAREVLAQNPSTKLSRWPRKVRVVPRGQPVLTPDVRPAVLEVVYQALLEERCFLARYRPRGALQPRDYTVTPLGLVSHGSTLVLVCELEGRKGPRHLLLHRMTSAEISEAPARTPPGFSLDGYLAQGHLGFKDSADLELRAIVDPMIAQTLHETPLARGQRLEPTSDGREILTVVVPGTLELRKWIAGHGAYIEVLAPTTLRVEIARMHHAAALLYADVEHGDRLCRILTGTVRSL